MDDCGAEIAEAACGCLCHVSLLEVSWGYWSQQIWESVVLLFSPLRDTSSTASGPQLTNCTSPGAALSHFSFLCGSICIFLGEKCSLTPSSQNNNLGNGLLPQLLDCPDLLQSKTEVSWPSSAVFQGPVCRRAFGFQTQSVRRAFPWLITLLLKVFQDLFGFA